MNRITSKSILFTLLLLGNSIAFAAQPAKNLCDALPNTLLSKLYPNVPIKKSGRQNVCTLTLSHPHTDMWQVIIQRENWDGNYEYKKNNFADQKTFKLVEGLGSEAFQMGLELHVKVSDKNILSVKTPLMFNTKQPDPYVTQETQQKAMKEIVQVLLQK